MIARLPGFTLIELMVALAIFGLLLMLAGPQLAIFMANSQVRNASEAMLNGVQQAQSVAVGANAPVCLIVDPTSGSGGWQIFEAEPTSVDCPAVLEPDPPPKSKPLKVYTLHDGAPKVDVTSVPGDARKLVFDGFGRILDKEADGTDYTPLTCLKVTHPTSGTRPLSVAISSAGLAVGTKLCDPDPNNTLPVGDPMICPAQCK